MAKEYKVKVYQQKEFGALKKVIFPFNQNLITIDEFETYYECTVDAVFDINTFKETYPNLDILEVFFCVFNHDNLNRTNYPINYSLSVGDIIELDGKKHQVMSSGFKNLSY